MYNYSYNPSKQYSRLPAAAGQGTSFV